MKYIFWLFSLLPGLLVSCSSGRKAMEKGDYFTAVNQSVDRLRSRPSDEKAANVLKESYDLTLKWVQDELDIILSRNNAFRWEDALSLMERVNSLSSSIRLSPAAMKIIPDPKIYKDEINLATDKAAEARYIEGERLLNLNSKEAAREAYINFERCDQLVKGYRDVTAKLNVSKSMATMTVIVESIPVHAKAFQITAGFFYDQVFEFLINRFDDRSFIRFYKPEEAERMELEYPDLILRLEFYDFVVGDAIHNESEQELTRDVKIEKKDTTRVEYKTYRAKLKTISDKIISGGLLEVGITEFNSSRLLYSEKIPGEFTWQNQYGLFVGDIEALNDFQRNLVERRVVSPPPPQTLFMEFTRPIFDQLKGKLPRFFQKYNQ